MNIGYEMGECTCAQMSEIEKLKLWKTTMGYYFAKNEQYVLIIEYWNYKVLL